MIRRHPRSALRWLWPLLLLAGLLAFAACGGAPGGQAAAGGSGGGSEGVSEGGVLSGEATVDIVSGLRYSPADITVKVGTKVTWVNRDTSGMVHDVASGVLSGSDLKLDGRFHSPMLGQGQSWSYTFDEAGTYPYLCTVPGHAQAGMVGTVTVVP